VPRVSLKTPYRCFLQESAWILNEFNQALYQFRKGGITIRTFSLTAEMAAIRLHDSWARFCREIILSSAVDEPSTAQTIQLPKAPGILRRSDAIASILLAMRLRYEPRWATASQAVSAANALRIANLATVSAALGAANSPAEDLCHVRNYFAHRAENTASQVKGLSFYSAGLNLDALDLLGSTVSGGVSRFESWVLGLRAMADAAIQ